ncbi:PASTA domain-containing protein [Tenacibaculum finnmarkense genomovar finnmarkense]|uniref:PASTA domain-containing protein n=1 Tax=Tenacibaculum finnmarkense genomovar finnmarkense TaxID=1458503 RepID=A0AAP1WG19_9FLAO|nr:PASTA domain-containing protein [Tenacibaculum finnmarkense]MBE7652627.1 PASTA domain-containing protein [Tenacibaculum finnmarkense genomovar finnmarkense]MBE7660276.1 PASTA domain-containing protein [Tenacibaculum finnmarkense genomovar finnmarkense]MBE7692722.1 PASTA domain-containing protein [Tenacibaculum finnmarkense genomovar finnmarkense]MBE7694926.1 PASTA domain-containing protein [Tenacibaculum finnmarkense genomovar finnmarkense]MCD8412222.1 PASTA domain-containing protein [Tenac
MSNFSEKLKNLFQFIKSKTFFIQIGIAVVSLFITVFVLKWWLGFTTNHDQKIQVPNLHKMSLAQVEKKLEELNLDFIIIDSATYNPEYPKKSVIEQNPAVNDFVKEKRKIYLTLNPSKYRDIEVPNLNGRTKRQATTHLRSQGFIVGNEITWVEDIGKDVVRGLKYNGKEITVGTKLPKKTTINLILGDGNGN